MGGMNAARSISVTGADADAGRDDDRGAPLILHTTRGDIRAALHEAERPVGGVVWVYGAWGGLDGPAGGIYPLLGEDLVPANITSLRVDYRVPGNLDEAELDTLAGVLFLEGRGCRRIALVGHSFGGAVVIGAAPRSPAVTAVVALSSQTAGAQGASLVSPRPLLLVHGEADTHLPPACSQAIYQWAGEPKELVLLPGATHSLWQRKAELRDLLEEWLVRHLSAPTPGPG